MEYDSVTLFFSIFFLSSFFPSFISIYVDIIWDFNRRYGTSCTRIWIRASHIFVSLRTRQKSYRKRNCLAFYLVDFIFFPRSFWKLLWLFSHPSLCSVSRNYGYVCLCHSNVRLLMLAYIHQNSASIFDSFTLSKCSSFVLQMLFLSMYQNVSQKHRKQ